MPELAEVETVRKVLLKELCGLTITKVDVRYDSIIDQDVSYFINNVTNKKIVNMSRIGKYLIFNLNDGNIVSHLRMEGKYFYMEQSNVYSKHIHVIFYLSNNHILCYHDVRKFGRMEYKTNDDLYTTEPLSKLGVDPILNSKIDAEEIYKKIIRRKLPIKAVLLDQSIICGLGNIYVDEVLFACQINPHKSACDITLLDTKNIIRESIRILAKAISCGGTTIRSYTSSLGVTGQYQNYLKVHTKDVCPICGSKITKDVVGGRGTYYCEVCQK